MRVEWAKAGCLLLWLSVGQTAAAEAFKVVKVFDGDTILLADGRKVRLLGINTPETDNSYRHAETGGQEAKAWLTQRLNGAAVQLETDAQTLDRYGRLLAYVFDLQDNLINRELVANGLATVSIFPPNLKHADELLNAQQRAEHAALGLWAAPAYARLDHRQLNAENYHGWKRLTGNVTAVSSGKHSHFLQFSDQVAVQIDNRYLHLFPPLAGYLGKTLEARGWPYQSRYGFTLPVAHPGNLLVLDGGNRP